MTLTYYDLTLKELVTPEIEALATADVDAIAAFTAAWRDRLVMLRVYVLLCLHYQQTDEDAYALKLAAYRAQYKEALEQAKKALAAASGALLTIPIERA